MKYNKQKARRLIEIAKRSIAIISFLMDGDTRDEVITKTGASRQLVEYYIKQLTTKD